MNTWIESLPTPTPDRRLEALATENLNQSPYRELRRVACSARGNVVTLTGTVSSYYYKQLAQEQVQKNLAAEIALDNRLEVTASSF